MSAMRKTKNNRKEKIRASNARGEKGLKNLQAKPEVFDQAPKLDEEPSAPPNLSFPLTRPAVEPVIELSDAAIEKNWDEEEEVLDLPEEQITAPVLVEEAPIEEPKKPKKIEEEVVESPRTQVKGFVKTTSTEVEEAIPQMYPVFVPNGTRTRLGAFFNGKASVYALTPETIDTGFYIGYVKRGVTLKGRPNCHAIELLQPIPNGPVSSIVEDAWEELGLMAEYDVMTHMSREMVMAHLLAVLEENRQEFLDGGANPMALVERGLGMEFLGASVSGKGDPIFVFKKKK